MHLMEEETRKLAIAYIEGGLLSEECLKYKCHIADCDACYEKFCIEYSLQRSLVDAGIFNVEGLKGTLVPDNLYMETVLLRIDEIVNGAKMKIKKIKQDAGGLWEFYPMPRLAYRGGESKNDELIFENNVSEYSYIKNDGNKLKISLDKEYYDTNNIRLKIIMNGNVTYLELAYNDNDECYEAEFDISDMIDAQIDIVEIEEE